MGTFEMFDPTSIRDVFLFLSTSHLRRKGTVSVLMNTKIRILPGFYGGSDRAAAGGATQQRGCTVGCESLLRKSGMDGEVGSCVPFTVGVRSAISAINSHIHVKCIEKITRRHADPMHQHSVQYSSNATHSESRPEA